MTDFKDFTESLREWFSKNKRVFPWRKFQEVYPIWISEVMSQQTQISRVAEHFYPRFLERFPNIESLAQSTWEDVYPFWEGLGYYSRGKNMLKTAQIVAYEYKGLWPKNTSDLQKLPGIGRYTACAIASFAYGEKVPAIDTNLSHIISVLYKGHDVHKVAQGLLKTWGDSASWNSAMMDLASFLKSGKKIEGSLEAFFPPAIASEFLPKRKILPPKINSKKGTKSEGKDLFRIEVGVACIHQNGKYLIQTRPKGKSFEGMWEFPGGKKKKHEDYRGCVKREVKEEMGITVSVRPHFCETIHEFEERVLILRFHRCQIQEGNPEPLEQQEIQWVEPENFDQINFLPTNKEALEKLKKIRV